MDHGSSVSHHIFILDIHPLVIPAGLCFHVEMNVEPFGLYHCANGGTGLCGWFRLEGYIARGVQ